MDPYYLIKEYVFKLENVNRFHIFEAGFGTDLKPIIDSFHKVQFASYTGVESKIFPHVYSYQNRELFGVENIENNAYPCIGDILIENSIYEAYLEYSRENNFIALPMQLFTKILNFKFSSKVEEYIEINSIIKEKFDLGIFNQILYLLNANDQSKIIPKKIIKWFSDNSTPKAYLHMILRTEDTVGIVTSEKPKCPREEWYDKNEIDELIQIFRGRLLYQSKYNAYFHAYLIQKV